MFKWFSRKCRIKLDTLVSDELYQTERDLFEAEGVLERATVNVQMLTTRRNRLKARGTGAMSPEAADKLVADCRARIPRNPEQEATS